MMLSLVVLIHLPFIIHAAVPCTQSSECVDLLRSGSECINGLCTNPLVQGCLHHELTYGEFLSEEYPDPIELEKKHAYLRSLLKVDDIDTSSIGSEQQDTQRLCNSDDDVTTIVNEGKCRQPNELFNFTEIRIAPNNWESAMFFGWIVQILLSEILGVPSTIETGSSPKEAPDQLLNFYDAHNPFYYPPEVNPFSFLREANLQGGTCTGRRSSETDDDAGDTGMDVDTEVDNDENKEHVPCAQFLPEVWVTPPSEYERDEFQSAANGFISYNGMYIPLYTLDEYPQFGSYMGLSQNRTLIAEVFKRPTTWKDYCDNNNCTTGNEVASRYPEPEEEGLYYSGGDYTGYFSPNECVEGEEDKCVGHFIDYPCSWQALTENQLYWNDLALERVHYSYGEMIQIFKAAKATRSHIIILWWQPEPNIDYDYKRVILPQVTRQCLDNRKNSKSTRCTDAFSEAIGNEGSGCDYAVDMTEKHIAQSLIDNTFDKPRILRSPAYELLDKIRVNKVDFEDMLNHWANRDVDTWGYDGRDAVCKWLLTNLVGNGANKLDQFLPPGYPRRVKSKSRSDSIGSIVVASVTSVLIVVVTYLMYRFRHRENIVFAQSSCLYLLCGGYLLLSTSAIVYGLQPTNATCMSREWVLMIGYTVVGYTLVMKTSAINEKANDQKSHKIQGYVPKRKLFISLSALLLTTIIYLACWTAFSPSLRQEDMVFMSDEDERNGDITIQVSCSTDSGISNWKLFTDCLEMVYVACAALLVYQSKTATIKFHEITHIRLMVYTNFFFALVRLVLSHIPSDFWKHPGTKTMVISILLSVGCLVNICVYFAPKLYLIRTRPDLQFDLLRTGTRGKDETQNKVSWSDDVQYRRPSVGSLPDEPQPRRLSSSIEMNPNICVDCERKRLIQSQT